MIEPERVRNPLRVTASRTCFFRETSGGELLERPRHERRTIRIGHQALARPFRGVEIADRRNEHPPALFEGHSHSRPRPLGSHVIVELGEGREHAFHQLARRCVVDRLGHRA
jgi:hypothetical protein